jgi:hypothetical protein
MVMGGHPNTLIFIPDKIVSLNVSGMEIGAGHLD